MDWLIDLLESPLLATALVLVVPLIVGLVEWLKAQGLPSRWAPLASVGLGVLIAALSLLAQRYPTVADWGGVAIVGVILGLAASGLYSGQKAVRRGDDG